MSREKIASEIKKLLEESRCPYFFRRESMVFSVNPDYPGPMGNNQILIYVNDTSFVTLCVSPLSADPKDEQCMREMGRFLHRINYGMHQGTFEMNVDSGKLQYKVYVDCENMLPSEAVIYNSIRCPVEMFRCYGEGIGGILFGGWRAEEAIRLCEAEYTADTRDKEKCDVAAAKGMRTVHDKNKNHQRSFDADDDMLSGLDDDDIRLFGLDDDIDCEEPDI